MAKFGSVSTSRLATCAPPLIAICEKAIIFVNFSVLCGHRNEEEQDEAFRMGNSTKRWPESKHNKLPSLAVDVGPYVPGIKIDWSDTAAFARLAGYLERIADEMGVRIRWGGDWNDNFRTKDERLIDMPHLELVS